MSHPNETVAEHPAEAWRQNLRNEHDALLRGPRPAWWWTGVAPSDCPGRQADGTLTALPQPNLTTCTRESVLAAFDNGWTLTEVLFAGLQGEKLKQALAGDDGERIQAVKDYAKELGDQHPAVRDWLQNVGDHAKQAAVAGAKQAQDAAATAREHLAKFADAVEQRRNESKFKRTEPGGDVVDAESFTVEGAGKPRRPKKSEDDSGVREALAAKLAQQSDVEYAVDRKSVV